MFDRCSSSQPPPDEGHLLSESHYSDPNATNEQGFYRENSLFYQNYHQNLHHSTSQHQEALYLQNEPHNSQFIQQFQHPPPQSGQRIEYDVFNDYGKTEQKGGQFYMDQNLQTPRYDQQQVKVEYQEYHHTQHQEESHSGTGQQITAQISADKKKRGRPSKKESPEDQEMQKKKRNLNRFDGLSMEEVMSRTLPDVIEHNLDILIIGINPGLMSAYKGHHYPNPGNHFWKCLFLSGLTEKQLNYLHDQSLPQEYGIGFTNMVERTTPGSKDLSSKEIREGGRQLLDKLQKYRPLIAAFNGKGIYEIFCKETFGVKAKNLEFGLQPYKIPQTETVCFLMPSSSPRCAQFPRAQDKVHFYIKLKELRDQLKGTDRPRVVEETQYSFDLNMAKEDAKRMAIKEEQHDPEYESCARVSSEQMPGPTNV